MKKMLTFLTLALFTVSLIAVDAEARRMGGGKSFGKQRQSLNQQSAPNQQQSPTPAQSPAAPAGGGSKWGGAIAGLAAGGLLAALFMGGAFEGVNMVDIIMLLLIAGAVFFIIRMLRKPRAAESLQRMQYSGMDTVAQNSAVTPPGRVAGFPFVDNNQAQTRRPNIPPGFQVEPFLRNAKTSFIRLQAANDAGDINDIREYTTPEMFAEISMQIQERGNVEQRSEVMFIDAKLLDVETNDDSAIASVRFTGQVRELPDGEPEDFDEVWHVEKNLTDANAVWLLAGIQQVVDTDLTD
ncbi:Predicted lipid-binding transport protein, Tim44 family [Nitrosomonas sp. Nm51]|uniref:Tim44 domain-containing protein n=1 Tax=Nitrosomonas sp. Nm51 TaxID=133720 RepID=UPI0008D7FD81|nr:TIM44-like domain-containing protein [Nitrosomonas sp. Nm51]SER04170.1 Predicted lipid-binding transport protein, Tim44 family [Nitrosomonas sp. Nm51]